jgi:hypothetical protein
MLSDLEYQIEDFILYCTSKNLSKKQYSAMSSPSSSTLAPTTVKPLISLVFFTIFKVYQIRIF